MERLEKAKRHLSQAITYPTVSNHDINKMDLEIFTAFRAFLEEAYPLLHQKLDKTLVNGHGLVFHWTGTDPARLPILLTAHYDVVPAKEDGWPHPPFSGALADGKIWGRGTFDDKGSLIAILETVEELLAEGFTPPRDIYFAFGFDEECNGFNGAQKISEYFLEKKIRFEYVLDEGGAVADGSMMGIEPPIAVIGIAEKGNSSFRFTFQGAEGHTSTPPEHTALGKMAAFIKDVEDHPRPYRLTGTVASMMKSIAPYMPGLSQTVARNPELFFFVLKRVLGKSVQTQAMLRTTVAFTMADCGEAPNVLPKTASCVANIRILQGDSVDSILDWLRSFGHDFEVEPLAAENPTDPSSLDTDGYRHLIGTIHETFDLVVPTPYLMTGGTDCRHYEKNADNSYRFLPTRVTEHELSLMHGTGEYLSDDNLLNLLNFYKTFISTLR